MGSAALLVLISDERDIVGSLAPSLSREDFRVLRCRTLPEGMRRTYENLPDVVVMEDDLSRIDTVDFCYQLSRLSRVPVVLLGKEGASPVLGFERGANCYLRRPIEPDELIARINSLLRRQDGFLLNLRRLMNADEKSIALNGGLVKLSKTEFRLLAYIMLGRGRYVTVKELLCHIWPGKKVSDDSVRFYISRLRQKLDHSISILNRRGVGYRISDMAGLASA